jgi:hypothetical protein
MQQPPRPTGTDPDLTGLPEPVRRAVASVHRQVIEAPAGPTAPPRLDDRLLLEAEAVRRSRLMEAFLRGGPGTYRAGPRAGRGLWAGAAVALGLALAIGLLALIQATMDQQARAAHAPRTGVVQVDRSL